MTVFISHASDDAVSAKRIEDLIAYDGYKSWRFQRDMMTANPADPQLPSNIEASDTFLFCISDHSQRSETCQKELQHAALLQKPLVTVRLNRRTRVPHPLNDHQWVDFDESPESTVQLLKALRNAKALRREKIPSDWTMWDGKTKDDLSVANSDTQEIPLPRMRRRLTDLEKETFLNEAIAVIRQYFGQALGDFENTVTQIQTNISDETSTLFKCQVYLNGDIKKSCAIWKSDNRGFIGIGYYEDYGRMSFFDTNSYNEMARVVELDGNPALEFTMGMVMFARNDDCRICTVEKACECLWMHFTREFNQEPPI